MSFKRIIPVLISFFLLFISGCGAAKNVKQQTSAVQNDAATQIAMMVIKNSNKLPNKTIAVIDFTDIQNRPFEYGGLLAERIIVKIAGSGELRVMERRQINRILEEQKLGVSGLTEWKNVQTVGNLLNVDALLTGTIAVFPDHYEINAKLIDVKTGMVLAAISVNDVVTSSSARNEVVEVGPDAVSDTPRVDIISSKLEKIRDGVGKGFYTIRITGEGKYVPSADEPAAFKDLVSVVKVELLDRDGDKISDFNAVFYAGAYGRAENVKPGKAFPFKAEDMMIKKEIWEQVKSYKFIQWKFVK